MANLQRKSHFLGAKLRGIRKRNGLTLEELSSRCIQMDAQLAPSVSYLSMIESGKRMPSEDVLGLLAGVFQRHWSRRFCSPRSCCSRRSRSCWRRPGPAAGSSRTC